MIIILIFISKLLFMLNWTTKLGTENHGSKIGIILKVSVNYADFSYVILVSNCFNTSTPKFTDTFRQKCVDYSCKQYVQYEYQDILAHKIMHEDMVWLKICVKNADFVCIIFFGSNTPNTHITCNLFAMINNKLYSYRVFIYL